MVPINLQCYSSVLFKTTFFSDCVKEKHVVYTCHLLVKGCKQAFLDSAIGTMVANLTPNIKKSRNF